MEPPYWALLERELLRANAMAVEEWADKYLDDRGYLQITPRWGGLDGPDDATENFYNWPLLHALGAPDKVLAMLFFFSSTRTRASFEAGMAQLGGHATTAPGPTPHQRTTLHRTGLGFDSHWP